MLGLVDGDLLGDNDGEEEVNRRIRWGSEQGLLGVEWRWCPRYIYNVVICRYSWREVVVHIGGRVKAVA